MLTYQSSDIRRKQARLMPGGLGAICHERIGTALIRRRGACLSRGFYGSVVALAAGAISACATGCSVGFFPHGSSYAIAIDLTDAMTGKSITGANIVATNGDYTIPFQESLPGLYEGVQVPGTFTITIEARGYVSKVIDEVIAAQLLPGEFAAIGLNVALSPAQGM